MGGDAESRGAKEEANTFLLQVLGDGPVAAKEVKRQAEDAGISVASLRRAKSSLRVSVKREGFGPGSVVLWELSNTGSSIGAHRVEPEKVSTYAEVEEIHCVGGGKGHIGAIGQFHGRDVLVTPATRWKLWWAVLGSNQ